MLKRDHGANRCSCDSSRVRPPRAAVRPPATVRDVLGREPHLRDLVAVGAGKFIHLDNVRD